MRFCGPFEPKRTILRPVLTQKAVSDRLDDLAGTENRAQPNGLPSERIGSTFLAIDDADCRPDGQAGVAQRLDPLEQRAAGGDDVFDGTHRSAPEEDALEPVRRAVRLLGLANAEKAQAAAAVRLPASRS